MTDDTDQLEIPQRPPMSAERAADHLASLAAMPEFYGCHEAEVFRMGAAALRAQGELLEALRAMLEPLGSSSRCFICGRSNPMHGRNCPIPIAETAITNATKEPKP